MYKLLRWLWTQREHVLNVLALVVLLVLVRMLGRAGCHQYIVRLQLAIAGVRCYGYHARRLTLAIVAHAILYARLARLLELLGMALLAMRMLVRIRIERLGAMRTLVEHLARVRGHVLLEIDGLLEFLLAHAAAMHTIRIVHIALMAEHGAAIGRDLAANVAGAFLGGAIVPAHMFL